MMNRAEQKLVLELCRCHNPNTKQIENLKKQGADEAVVLGQLLFHRVAGTAYMTRENASFVFFGLQKTVLLTKRPRYAIIKAENFLTSVRFHKKYRLYN